MRFFGLFFLNSAYAILTETLVYKILGHLTYPFTLNNGKALMTFSA